MRFRKSSSQPYFNKADQVRTLRLFGLLALVVVCMTLAADPGMWTWLFPKSAPEAAKDDAASKEIDYGIKFEEESDLSPDAFRSRPDDAGSRTHHPAVADASPERLLKQTNQLPVFPGAGKTTAVGDYVVEIDPAIFAEVSDDWLEIRQREAPAFYTILAKANEIPQKLLEEAGDDRVDYTVLMTDSEQFRGQPLSVEGTIRRIDEISITREDIEEDYGIDRYYVAWMFTESSGNSPYRLIAVGLPEDMPTGEDLDLPAKFTGYFFKRQGYRSVGGFHKAPVLIGKYIRWNRPAATVTNLPQDSGLAPYAIGLAVIIAVGLGLLIWRFNVSDKKFAHKHVDHFTTAAPEAIQDLENLETSDPNDLFRRMQEEAIAAELEAGDSVGEPADSKP